MSLKKKMSARGVVVLLTAALGCGGGGGKPGGVFVYRDLACSAPAPGGGAQCHDVGDGLSYPICASNQDCPKSAPYCRVLGLFQGGDYSCNGTVQICRPVDHDDCAR